MGKLVEKLQQISQSTGSGMGFAFPRTAGRKPRPAGVFVSLLATDGAVAEAAVKQGVDGLVVAEWTATTDTAAIKAAAGSTALWGVDATGIEQATAETLKAAASAGAGFAIVTMRAQASLFVEETESIDRVLLVEPPTNDLALLMLRNLAVLPAEGALVRLDVSAQSLAKLTVDDYTRLRVIAESIRWPTLITVKDTPDASSVRMLVQMADAIVLRCEGGAPDVAGDAVRTVREALEQTPAKRDQTSTTLLGGLMAASGASLAPHPEREPEPEHE